MGYKCINIVNIFDSYSFRQTTVIDMLFVVVGCC